MDEGVFDGGRRRQAGDDGAEGLMRDVGRVVSKRGHDVD